MLTNANFGFLDEYDATLVALPAQAETYFRTDPSTALIKLRQFAELLIAMGYGGSINDLDRALVGRVLLGRDT